MSVRAAVVGGGCLAAPIGLRAQDVQPRAYTPAPVGVNVITLGYAFSSGEVLFDNTIPIDDATGEMHSFTAAYSRSMGVLGRTARVDVALPFVTGDWEGDFGRTRETASRTGLGDPVVRISMSLVGAPALTRKQFAGFQPGTIVGATLRINLPLGEYDAEQVVNLGSHRWAFSPQLGVSHVAGDFVLEAYAGAWFFTDNDEFLGTSALSQDPLYSFQVHVGYRFRPGFWIAASSRQSLGGATKLDGGDKLDPEANNRVGLTLAYPVGGKYALRFVATTGTTAKVGNDYTTFAVAWQVVL